MLPATALVENEAGARLLVGFNAWMVHDSGMDYLKWSSDKLDVLQNLEFSVVTVWRAHREMSDYAALRAYEAAFQVYRAESRGQIPKPPGLNGLDAAAFEAVNTMCEYRLGRKPCPAQGPEVLSPISLELLLDCLRGLAKSVERHTRTGGRQGYLSFIEKFLPQS